MAVEHWTDERLNQLADAVAANTQGIAELKTGLAELKATSEKTDIRLEAYQRASTQVVNLAFGLIVSGTLALIISATTYYIRVFKP